MPVPDPEAESPTEELGAEDDEAPEAPEIPDAPVAVLGAVDPTGPVAGPEGPEVPPVAPTVPVAPVVEAGAIPEVDAFVALELGEGLEEGLGEELLSPHAERHTAKSHSGTV